jgi:hypothetical protein
MDTARANEALERSLQSLRRASVTLERVIAQNQRLAALPGHEASARRRIREAGAELRTIRRQEAALVSRLGGRGSYAGMPFAADEPNEALNPSEGGRSSR